MAKRSKISVVDGGDGVGDECEDLPGDRAFEAAKDFLGALAFLLLALNVVLRPPSNRPPSNRPHSNDL